MTSPSSDESPIYLDFSPAAVEQRLRQASDLRDCCLALARNEITYELMRRFPKDPVLSRTALAIGFVPGLPATVDAETAP